MRGFHKNTQVPTVLRENGPAKTQELVDAVAGGNDSPKIDALYRHPEVKAQLKSDQNGKCAYCERKFNGDFGAVEHYRPKAAWQQGRGNALEKPGYYWLAYAWENLLYSCDECNTICKKNLFPLANPKSRDIAHRDISGEDALLINPSIEDPGLYIAFHKEMAVPRMIDGMPSAKGIRTIDVLGLNSRLALKQARREAFFEVKTLKKLRAILLTTDNVQALPDIDNIIRMHTSEYAEFTGMFQNQV